MNAPKKPSRPAAHTYHVWVCPKHRGQVSQSGICYEGNPSHVVNQPERLEFVVEGNTQQRRRAIMTKMVFIDLETTGTDPTLHDIWDVGLVVVQDGKVVGEDQWFHNLDSIQLSRADSGALRVSHFYERHPEMDGPDGSLIDAPESALNIARITSNSILAGNVVSFDAAFLTELLSRYGFVPAWHYHLLDVEAFAAGALALTPPWSSKEVSAELGVKQPTDQHSALADAKWSLEIYQAALALSAHHSEKPTG